MPREGPGAITDRIVDICHDLGSQKELAKALGVSPPAITNWTSGEHKFESWLRLAELAKASGRSADWILGLEEQRAPTPREISVLVDLLEITLGTLKKYSREDGPETTGEELLEAQHEMLRVLGLTSPYITGSLSSSEVHEGDDE